MIHELCAGPEFRRAFGQYPVHLNERGRDLGGYYFRRCAPRTGPLRRFPSRRHVPDPDNNERLNSLFPAGFRRERLARLEQTATTFDRTAVGEIKMFEDFGDTPLIGSVPYQLLG